MPSHEQMRTNDDGDAKVAAMLERLDERMGWMRDEAKDRKRQVEMMFGLLDQLRETTASLKTGVDTLTKDFAATVELQRRVQQTEETLRIMQADVRENTAFRKAAVKWAALIGLASIIGKTALDKATAAMGVHL